MNKFTILLLTIALALTATKGLAFCGFYVARADANLFNQASQVVLVRDDDRTVLTMNNDFAGDVTEFAMVIPVPVVLKEGQIHVTERSLIDHLDAYSAPRLVEYFDEDPCARLRIYELSDSAVMGSVPLPSSAPAQTKELGVTIEARYAIGEYDILILSAIESDGLVTWLEQNDYRLPDGAKSVIGSYLKQGMKFFVAKVNLDKHTTLGFTYLRPLQIAYESPKFMLPIRLGMLNAKGTQELYIYALTRNGRVETRNYRTVKLPTDVELPTHIKDDFGNFYQALFERQTARENNRAVFLEYAWDMGWCDPCAADPLSATQLRELGVFWVDPGDQQIAQNVFITRLHVQYDKQNFPSDLTFQETGDRSNYQGRYIIRHPWTAASYCKEADEYRNHTLPKRQRREAQTLANLTGWSLSTIYERMQLSALPIEPWWKTLWSH